jgi:hypothetical protein
VVLSSTAYTCGNADTPTDMTSSKQEYRVETTRTGLDAWHWEIMRNGRPLDARLRDGPLKSQMTAMAAWNCGTERVLETTEARRRIVTLSWPVPSVPLFWS